MNRKVKTFTLDEMIDRHVGKRGTVKREQFETELKLELIGEAIKKVRQERNLTQEQLGDLVGVQKAQISKLENSITNVRIDTVLRVFNALGAKIKFSIDL